MNETDERQLLERYRNASNEELEALVAQGVSQFTDTAWALLTLEMKARRIEGRSPAEEPHDTIEGDRGKPKGLRAGYSAMVWVTGLGALMFAVKGLSGEDLEWHDLGGFLFWFLLVGWLVLRRGAKQRDKTG